LSEDYCNFFIHLRFGFITMSDRSSSKSNDGFLAGGLRWMDIFAVTRNRSNNCLSFTFKKSVSQS